MTRISGTLELDKLANTESNTDAISKAMTGVAPGQYADKTTEMIGELTKGRKGGFSDDHAVAADTFFRKAIKKGFEAPAEVAKGLNPMFSGAIGAAMQTPQSAAMGQLVGQLEQILGTELGKNISLTSPLASGLVPFDLAAPAKLIYPVHSPLRNLFPRVPGQGLSHRAKVITAVSGSAMGGLATPGNRMSISEFPNGGSFSQWPGNLPGSGSQTAIDLNVPYKFFGLSENVSWLSQFAGQGFEDNAGLASLILLQEMMMLEERAILSATATALSTPAQVTLTARSANSGEVGISGVTTNVYVQTTAVNLYGETLPSTVASVAASNGQVIDVTLTQVSGGFASNIYTGTGTAAPANSGMHLQTAGVGATKFTIQGALPTTGATPPTADTGTSSANDYEGLVSTVSGHAAGGVYPAGYQGSYVNQAVGDILSVNTVNNALQAMYNGASGIGADPDFILTEAGDQMRLGASIANAGTGTAGYRLEVSQDQVDGVRVGTKVREFVNPITGKVIDMRSHPYLAQGTAMPISLKLPQPQQNISNVWENVMVQDYLSISWPVIDVTFRYSMFMYGTLFCPAVQYNGLIQGIQKTVASGTTGTYS
ncbi:MULTISPECIES: hypothetical protein [Arthrobacter]|uniref:Uncharacterized protein n=1 Tax=Arthrobacter terricola TaxID=2547396 RepID=A0A4R5KMM3_9MICC|nr:MULTISPECIES: hypothetical protein [Arthrobacter]MBT8160997.1 hypothetical protein [Arthrobacter sp. GN70]TDF96861.1 hypothetical protein E1809_09055 [Arthrobacter terricola]